MKLRFEPQPDDHFAILIDRDNDSTLITVACENASSIAIEIAHRVNRYDAMVATLTPFASNAMGQLLVDLILSDPPPGVSNDTMNEVHARLRKLVGTIDLILKGVELHKERQHDQTPA